MVRIKRGVITRAKHKKVLELAKGFRMTKSRLIKVATEAVLHAGEYAFAGRKQRKRQFRRLWIIRINAALRLGGLKYSEFIHLLRKNNVLVDRKIWSYLAQQPTLFERAIKSLKEM
ncbi:MAG: 50S ribosomal protein L20 [Patescibacteria group bacterium]